jgi:Eco57I restriction-modification methylase
MREAAGKQLGVEASHSEIEDGQLLRRLIARRCIYGVDVNPLAVELARLSIWIHTFVPGLPLTMLDHNLVPGNALIGIGTIDDIKRRFELAGTSLFPINADNLLGPAKLPLTRLAHLEDATLKDVAAARDAMKQARVALGPTEALCDIITAEPIDSSIDFQPETWGRQSPELQCSRVLRKARTALEGLHAFHFPVAFPEVFLRGRAGFDVIIGNPPWKKPKVEEHGFWARYFPGLRSLVQRDLERERERLRRERPDLVRLYERELAEMDRLREALSRGAYPGMGTGDPDTYKAFCWRFWKLVASEGGRIGVVLPRSAMSAKGSETFRKEIFAKADVDLTMLSNRGGWVFDEAEHRYTIGLTSITKGDPREASIGLRGPFANLGSFEAGKSAPAARFSAAEVLSWNDSASLPLLPTDRSVEIFAQYRKAPRLDLNDGTCWRARPDTELHATAQKPLMDLVSETCPKGFWPVFKGESFDIWTPDTGEYYAYADPDVVIPWIYGKRLKSGKSRRGSAHSEFSLPFRQDKKTLACHHPRIAFRDITNRTNQRTLIACLLPASLFLTHKAPHLLWPCGDEKDQAFLLGILCSLPLDWYARRFVETNVTYFLLNQFPVPRPSYNDRRWERVVAVAGRLAAPDRRFADWAKAVGVEHGSLPEDQKQDMIAELDAVVARLYGLSEEQLIHIFETFHEGWDYAARLKAVRRHFRAWASRS